MEPLSSKNKVIIILFTVLTLETGDRKSDRKLILSQVAFVDYFGRSIIFYLQHYSLPPEKATQKTGKMFPRCSFTFSLHILALFAFCFITSFYFVLLSGSILFLVLRWSYLNYYLEFWC